MDSLYRARNLRQGIGMKPSIGNPVSSMWPGSVVDTKYFCLEMLIPVVSTQKHRPQKKTREFRSITILLSAPLSLDIKVNMYTFKDKGDFCRRHSNDE